MGVQSLGATALLKRSITYELKVIKCGGIMPVIDFPALYEGLLVIPLSAFSSIDSPD